MSDAIYTRPGEEVFSELDNAPTGLVGTVGVRIIRKSDQSEVLARTTAGIVESPAGSGRYQATLTAPVDRGAYTIFWDTGSVSPDTTGSDDLIVTYDLPGEEPPPEGSPLVTDPRDTRVLIPRLRRALDGPQAMSSASVSATLSDEQLNAIGADAIGMIIFYSGSLFGAQLEVSDRDAIYQSPTAWRTEPALTESQIAIVVSQAALDYFFSFLSTQPGGKTSQLIADESTRWEWSISPQAIVERLRQLRADRDRALEQLAAEDEEADASWVSFIETRDTQTSRLIEPWVGASGGGGQLLSP